MTVGHGWEAKLTGEVPILGRVIERLGLIIRILSMVNSGFVPDGCALYKTDGCLDAIPFQFYRTTTIPKIWVGLDWKFIYLSMGSLAAKV